MQTLRELSSSSIGALQTIDLAQLTSIDTTIVIRNNAALTRLVAPVLANLGDVDDISAIRNNPLLPTACATAIRNRVLANDIDEPTSGNAPTGICP